MGVGNVNYQREAMRTRNPDALKMIQKHLNPNTASMFEACLGLSGEVGEVTDLIKKIVFHDAKPDMEHLEKEIGDVLWYVALLCESLRLDMNEVMEKNIRKLWNRYPEGFDTYMSNHRKEGDI